MVKVMGWGVRKASPSDDVVSRALPLVNECVRIMFKSEGRTGWCRICIDWDAVLVCHNEETHEHEDGNSLANLCSCPTYDHKL